MAKDVTCLCVTLSADGCKNQQPLKLRKSDNEELKTEVMDWLNSQVAEYYLACLKNIFYGVQGA